MDYECDVGYFRSDDGRCIKDEIDEKKDSYGLTDEQEE